MGTSTNSAAVRRLIEQCVNQNRVELLHELVADDVIIYSSSPRQDVDGRGLDEFRGLISCIRQVFGDLHIEIDDLVSQNDRVAVRWTARGTHASEWLGVPAQHCPVVVGGMDMYVFDQGKIREWWRIADLYGLLEQLQDHHGTPKSQDHV